MRDDMDKVIVERPRLGRSGSNKAKGYWKRLQKGWPENLPRQEGIKRRSNGGTKFFNEHLGPLRRYLQSNVGRPWDKVFSEIRAHINVNSVVQAHILTHVFDYVAVNVVLLDGVPCHGDGRWYGRPLHERWGLFYVCPRTGLLRRVKRVARRPAQREGAPCYIRLDETHQCRLMDGAWYLVTVRRFPNLPPGPIMDATGTARDDVLERTLTVLEALRLYGAPVCGVSRRRLGKRKMRQLPIPIDLQK